MQAAAQTGNVSTSAARSGASRRRTLVAAGALIAAAIAVVMWNGNLRMLDPTDIDWITVDDPLAHEMGWEQFRASPLLQYPITRNDGYGLERGSSLVYSDSIPIVALVLRPLSPILPHPFQYLGWYTVLSLALQGYWGARLIRLRSDRTGHAVLGAAFCMIAPTLLNRIGLHAALTSQWLILCALWLYFASRELQARRWLLLLLLAVSIHGYLFVMAAAIWAAKLAACAIARTLRRRDLLSAAATVIAVVAWMHCIGYFVVGSGAAAGGGQSWADPVNFVAGTMWSALLPAIHGTPHAEAWDGQAYLGAGLMGLLVLGAGCALVARIRRRGAPAVGPARSPAEHPEVNWAPLIAVAAAFLVFAASDHVLFNGHEIVTYHWPWWMRRIVATFRGGGRMVWLMYYVLVVAILWFALRSLPRRAVVPLLAVGLAVQLVDFRAGAMVMRTGASRSGMIQPMGDPIWSLIQARYTRLVSVPAWHGQPDRQVLGWFAAVHGIGSNIGYFGRINPERQQQGARVELDQVLTGHYDPSTVYSFPRTELWNVARRIASPRDLVIIADGHRLVIPGANRSGTAPPDDTAVAPPLDTWLAFSAGGAAQGFLIEGWTWSEGWGTWSEGGTGTFLVPLPKGHRGKLRVSLRWIGHARGVQQVEVWFDQAKFTVEFPHDMAKRVDTFDVVPSHDWILVETRVLRPTRSKDGRLLGLGLIAIRIGDPEAPAAPSLPEKTQ